MRKKAWRLLVTFHTTAEAMAFEKACLAQSLPGRLIPIPTAITAGCGLAWSSALEERDALEQLLHNSTVTPQAVQEFFL